MALQAAAEGQMQTNEGEVAYEEHQMHQIYVGQKPKKRKVPKQTLNAQFMGNSKQTQGRTKRNNLMNKQAMGNTGPEMQDSNPLMRLMQPPKSTKNLTRPGTGNKKLKS